MGCGLSKKLSGTNNNPSFSGPTEWDPHTNAVPMYRPSSVNRWNGPAELDASLRARNRSDRERQERERREHEEKRKAEQRRIRDDERARRAAEDEQRRWQAAEQERQQKAQREREEEERRRNEEAERLRQELARRETIRAEAIQAEARRKQLEREESASPAGIRRLRELMQKKYRLDVYVWSKRDVQEENREFLVDHYTQSDQALQEIMQILKSWDKDLFHDAEEWRVVQKLKAAFKGEPQCPLWGDMLPWDPQRLEDDEDEY